MTLILSSKEITREGPYETDIRPPAFHWHMNPENFRIPSVNGKDDINGYIWIPSEPPKASLQIVHGMTEHILRYSDFAEYLCSRGIAVYGHDHLGHGGTSEEKGFFAEEDGDRMLVEDAHRVNQKMASDLQGIPHFIMGHSMGSFVTRRFLTIYGKDVDGAIIMGTGNQSSGAVSMGRFLAVLMCKLKSNHYRSKMLNNMVLGNYDKKFTEPDLPNRWLCSDPEALKGYGDDPLCGFTFTVAAYRDLFTLIKGLVKGEGLDNMPKDLPILMVSGQDDPVGDFGKGVEKARKALEDVGLKPELILYPGMRHEILNETDKAKVYSDIGDWLESRS